MVLEARSAKFYSRGVRGSTISLVVALHEVCGGDTAHSFVVTEDSFSSGVLV